MANKWFESARAGRPAPSQGIGIDRLPLEERLASVEEFWNSIAADGGALTLIEAQRAELEKRIAEDDAHPHDVTPWEQVKASTLARLGK
jgi:putative addiction module component (TIGR02574 family)